MSSVKFEIMMPATGWNGRFVQVGNSGLAGSIWTSVIAGQVSEGCAAAGTDDGSGLEGSLEWLSDRERVTDFGYRAVHLTALKAKEGIQAYYGKAAVHSYFVGSSKGGQEAMMKVERYPADFDGVAPGFPGFYVTHLMASGFWNAKALLDTPIPEAKLKLTTDAAVAGLAVAGELSWLNLVCPQALFLIPLLRFPGFLWLIAAGLALPKTIARVASWGTEAST